MQNLIKSRAAFEILKKPLPKLSHCYRDSESESDSDNDNDNEDTAATTIGATSATAATNTVGQLNVNASEFVPRSKVASEPENATLAELKRHLEALDERKPTQQRLLLPWRGFPKPMRVERPSNAKQKLIEKPDEIKNSLSLKRSQTDKEAQTMGIRKKQLKEKTSMKDSVPDERKREQERKVALEALKLVEQRRMRESLEEKPQIIVHLNRSPVNFTPEERVRVDRLRLIKREHIERVLREMELEMKKHKTQSIHSTGRYVGLQRAAKKDSEMNTETESKQQIQTNTEPESESEKQPPRRYIPTVKQWDERCKAKAHVTAANKENAMTRKPLVRPEENVTIQRAMISSSVDNIMPSTIASINSNCDNKEQQQHKDRELFVPRYWPPAPLVASGEKRRGNLTHARNISRAFANCGLLPTPTLPGAEHVNHFTEPIYELQNATKSVKRYGMDELLDLEPQPHELRKPYIHLELRKLGFMCE
ncbi:uncharacterized protein LOC117780798 isoform X2 [Drosophila innubila]|uniref:uncharacterized protein LOC117780798 isoform X2 n=1 Tax=Drosophila innubila TaxID=198719 RepID=UPI00148D0CBC|nr:uncharacterized protein LOC117780798 isoform X2 [Drosophila innubila]